MSQIVSKKFNDESVIDINDLRNEYIRLLDTNLTEEELVSISDDLFYLDLTVYSKNNNIDSLLYNELSKSVLDDSISLYPEQVELVKSIEQNEALIVSAPTSFGKTFCVFEYIAKNMPKNVVLIVPTLALVDEYLKKIISKYKNVFKQYKKYINFDSDASYSYENYNMFILTHDKVMESAIYKEIDNIDFMVIDEVYKLQKDDNNDRVLVLNLAYHYLSQKSKKYVLLAPFISDVEDREKLSKTPKLFRTNFSPVVNELDIIPVNSKNEKNEKIIELIQKHFQEKTLIYFPMVSDIPTFVKNVIVNNFPKINIKDTTVKSFISWVKNEIHNDWYVVKAMERGFLIHNGQLPSNGFRMYQLDLYDNSDEFFYLLCTSTILEGVNMSAKNIIITEPSRYKNKFDAFDFYNLVGRTGRLYQHYLGYAYYLKMPEDPNYNKSEAVKSIRFEATADSEDFDFYTNDSENCILYNEFLKRLGITADDYKENIGPKFKIKKINDIYDNYLNYKKDLDEEVVMLLANETRGRGHLIELLFLIMNPDENRSVKLKSYVINKLISKNRIKLKNIINNTVKTFNSSNNIDYIISLTLRYKSSYIEHEFYSLCKIILYFAQCNGCDESFVKIINQKVISAIESVYFSDSKCKKILKDLGIYEYDIEKIVSVIGEGLDDVNEIIDALKNSKFNNLNFISNYIIDRL